MSDFNHELPKKEPILLGLSGFCKEVYFIRVQGIYLSWEIGISHLLHVFSKTSEILLPYSLIIAKKAP